MIDRHFSARIRKCSIACCIKSRNAPSLLAFPEETLLHAARGSTAVEPHPELMARRPEGCRRWQVSDSRGLVIIPVGRAGHW
jgi:hypothetical protein